MDSAKKHKLNETKNQASGNQVVYSDPEKGFTTSNNYIKFDPRVSPEAKAVYSLIQTLIEMGDTPSHQKILKYNNMGREKLRRCERELESFGYIEKKSITIKGKRAFRWILYEVPKFLESPIREKPQNNRRKTGGGKSPVGSHHTKDKRKSKSSLKKEKFKKESFKNNTFSGYRNDETQKKDNPALGQSNVNLQEFHQHLKAWITPGKVESLFTDVQVIVENGKALLTVPYQFDVERVEECREEVEKSLKGMLSVKDIQLEIRSLEGVSEAA